MPTDIELATAYRAWWFDSYKHPPNAAAVATATHWARYVLGAYGRTGSPAGSPAGSPNPAHDPT
jgi:hypothetical protein